MERRSKDDRQSAVSKQCHVRSDIISDLTNIYKFIGRAKQPSQGVSHGAYQAEGSHVPQPWQGGGRVTPAHTADHVVHAQLHRHHVAVQSQLQPQEQVRGGEVALVYNDSAIAVPK